MTTTDIKTVLDDLIEHRERVWTDDRFAATVPIWLDGYEVALNYAIASLKDLLANYDSEEDTTP